MRKNYKLTMLSCFGSYLVQATVINFLPLLFITFHDSFGIPLQQITLLVTVNFIVQLAADLVAAIFIDRVGYRVGAVGSQVFCSVGLILLTFLPDLMPTPFMGIMISVIVYSVGAGLIEALISPIVESTPSDNKETAMSLLHSFYCWGHVFLVVASTAFFAVFGMANWRILACIWALVPLANVFYFMLVPIYPIVAEGEKQLPLRELLSKRVFWLLLVMMVCAGASEQAMSQWSSAFAEKALGVSKAIGDLAGPCAFAVFMGTARALYGKFAEKIPLKAFMLGSSAMCIGCYLLSSLTGNALLGLIGCAACGFSVGIFWPGTFSIAPGVLPGGGTAMYALMALCGDLGCSGGPTLVGFVAGAVGGQLQTGILAAIIFPVLMLLLTATLKERKA